MYTKIDQLIESLTHEMRVGIDDVLSGRSETFEASNITPTMVEKYLQPLGWKKGEFATNGWQYDWWLPFTKGSRSFTASGGGYYGGFNFQKTEE